MDDQARRIEICPMAPQHIEALEQLEKQCFSTPWSYDALVSELSNPLAVFRVAEIDGQVAGYVGMQHVVDEGYICNIAVFPQYRRLGVATRLMECLMDYAKEQDMEMISLEVRPSNLGAIRFYEKFGFEQEGRRRDFYSNPTEDALILTKRFGHLF